MIWTAVKLAEEAGLARQSVTRLLRSGKIVGERLTSGWIITDEEARKFLDGLKKKDQQKSGE